MTKPAFPPVPSQAFSHLGLLPVTVEPKGETEFGEFPFKARSISISAGMTPAAEWQTYWHECVHVALWDAGVRLKHEVEEQLCDVLGTYLAAAVGSGFLKVNPK